jgi:hypothetical protein
MSNSAPNGPAPFHPTRQQLDDLESLMRRMLDLPVGPHDGEARPTRAPFVEPEPVPAPLVEVVAPGPLFQSHEAEEASDSVLPAIHEEITAVRPSSAEGPMHLYDTDYRSRPVRRGSQVGLWKWPLVWSNRLFDRLTVPLGEPGRWLRGPTGRACLGWSGVLFLVTAAVWSVLDWMGWL